MAVFQNVFSFFSPGRSRPTPPAGGAAEQATFARALEDFDRQLHASAQAYNIPEQVIENLKSDFRAAWGVGAPVVTAYPLAKKRYEGLRAPGGLNLRVNLYDAFAAPGKVVEGWQKSVQNTFSGLPVTRYVEDQLIIEPLFNSFRDVYGNLIFTEETRDALSAWAVTSGVRSSRIFNEKELLSRMSGDRRTRFLEINNRRRSEVERLSDPKHMRERLDDLRTQSIGEFGGKDVQKAYLDTQYAENEVGRYKGLIDKAEKDASAFEIAGDKANAAKMKKAAASYKDSLKKELTEWHGRSADYSGEFREGIETKWRTEIATIDHNYRRMERYVKYRNIRYQTLNFLDTWHQKGFAGVLKTYAWDKFTDSLGILYPPTAIGEILKRISKTELVQTINKLNPLNLVNKAKAWVSEVAVRALSKAITAIATRLGIAELAGGALGTLVGGPIGTVVGAVLGAVATFVAGRIAERLGGIKGILGIVGYGVVGSCSCLLVTLFSFAILFVTIIVVIFNPDSDPAVIASQCDYSESAVNAALNNAASKYGVPSSLLRAVFEIEGLDYISSPGAYTCKENFAKAAGLMQITKGGEFGTYKYVTCPDERLDDDLAVCVSSGKKLSRCDVDDVFELAARVLLLKVNKWDNTSCKATGSISASNKIEIYRASCGYYGSPRPDTPTRNYSYNLPNPKREDPPGMNYSDIVCNKLNMCPPYPPQEIACKDY